MNINNKLNIPLIIKELNKLYAKNNEYNYFKYTEIKHIILSKLDSLSNKSIYSREIFVTTFLKKLEKNEITETNFKKIFEETKNEFNKKKEEKYTLLTSMSIDYIPFRKIKINGATIKIVGKNFPKKYLVHRKKVLANKKLIEEKSDFIKVIVIVKDKNFLDAFEKANYNLNILRAILCLNFNPSREIRLTSHYDRAINKIMYGKYHTLHFYETGKAIDDTSCWVETNLPISVEKFPYDKKELVKKTITDWLKRLENCNEKHKEKLSQVLNLYVNAFDETNKQTCFLKGWIALENLLNTNDNKQIITRCSSLYKVEYREYQKEILNGLRYQRNLIVHKNKNHNDFLVNCYHVQRFIKDLFIHNNLKYYKLIKNNDDAIFLLENRLLTSEKLSNQINLLKASQKFRIKST